MFPPMREREREKREMAQSKQYCTYTQAVRSWNKICQADINERLEDTQGASECCPKRNSKRILCTHTHSGFSFALSLSLLLQAIIA